MRPWKIAAAAGLAIVAVGDVRHASQAAAAGSGPGRWETTAVRR